MLISPRNHFLFTPLLPSTTVGTIEFRSIIEPVRTAQPGIRFLLAASETILLVFDAKLREYTAQRFRRKRFDWLKTAAFGRDISRF